MLLGWGPDPRSLRARCACGVEATPPGLAAARGFRCLQDEKVLSVSLLGVTRAAQRQVL